MVAIALDLPSRSLRVATQPKSVLATQLYGLPQHPDERIISSLVAVTEGDSNSCTKCPGLLLGDLWVRQVSCFVN